MREHTPGATAEVEHGREPLERHGRVELAGRRRTAVRPGRRARSTRARSQASRRNRQIASRERIRKLAEAPHCPSDWLRNCKDGAILADLDTAGLRDLCERTLRENWVEGVRASDGVPYAYTRPSPGHYPWQWYWDSCFAAIVWRRFDRARARPSSRRCSRPSATDGFIGHTIFWSGAAAGYRRVHLQRDLARRPDDRQHPAAAARVGMADRGR